MGIIDVNKSNKDSAEIGNKINVNLNELDKLEKTEEDAKEKNDDMRSMKKPSIFPLKAI